MTGRQHGGAQMADYGGELIGNDPKIETLRQLARRVARSAARTVLIYGETGTGKGLLARMIHQNSRRADKPFLDINCAAIPAGLMESEFFGHEKGAFTGASERKIGLVEAANHGSVFLDEIREMDPHLQAKLLSLLDTHQFRRVGAVKSTHVDLRFIAATNKVLLSEVMAGNFREDLYYRLQVVALNLPALRDRGDDVLVLAQHFITRFNMAFGRDIRGLAPETTEILRKYPWPGNVRELENLLERIFILEDEDIILPRHLPDRILRTVRSGAPAIPPAGDTALVSEGFHEATAQFQRGLVTRALEQSGGNQQDAANLLRLTRHALRHQIQKLGL